MAGESSRPYAVFMAGQFSEVPAMAVRVAGDPAFLRDAERFDAITGGSFTRWVTTDNKETLSRHEVASEAVVLFDAALGDAARERFGPPSLAAGYSLGFYAAASLAGVFPMEVALGWIRRVNAAMAGQFPEGAFSLAVSIGLTWEDLRSVFAGASLHGLEVANINNASQLVFAGPAAEVEAALKVLEGRVLSAKPIPIGYPLHTSYLKAIAEELAPWWRTVPLSDPRLPLLSPVDGRVLGSACEVRDTMLRSLVEPTDWVSVVRSASQAGVAWALDTSGDGSLGRMTRWVDRNLEVLPYREALGAVSP